MFRIRIYDTLDRDQPCILLNLNFYAKLSCGDKHLSLKTESREGGHAGYNL